MKKQKDTKKEKNGVMRKWGIVIPYQGRDKLIFDKPWRRMLAIERKEKVDLIKEP